MFYQCFFVYTFMTFMVKHSAPPFYGEISFHKRFVRPLGGGALNSRRDIYTHTRTHTYTRIYIYIYIYTYIYYIYTCIHTQIHAYNHAYIHVYIHTYVNKCTHTYT